MIPEYPFKSHYFDIRGEKLHYLDEGEGPAVVMVHGNPTWSYYYRNVVKTLSDNFRVIVPDHMGCGLSDKPQKYDYRLDTHISNLVALLEHLDLKPVSMIVHDWGGAIGMGYATRFPDLIEKLVVLNTAAFRSTRIPFRIRICRWPLIGPLLVRGVNGFARAALFMAVCRKMGKSTEKGYLFPYDSWKNRIAIYNFVRDIPLEKSHQSYQVLAGIEEGLTRLEQNNIPMLICWGGKDFCFNDHFFNEWKRRFPRSEHYYFEDAGHYILEDKKGTIEPLISEFLSR